MAINPDRFQPYCLSARHFTGVEAVCHTRNLKSPTNRLIHASWLVYLVKLTDFTEPTSFRDFLQLRTLHVVASLTAVAEQEVTGLSAFSAVRIVLKR